MLRGSRRHSGDRSLEGPCLRMEPTHTDELVGGVLRHPPRAWPHDHAAFAAQHRAHAARLGTSRDHAVKLHLIAVLVMPRARPGGDTARAGGILRCMRWPVVVVCVLAAIVGCTSSHARNGSSTSALGSASWFLTHVQMAGADAYSPPRLIALRLNTVVPESLSFDDGCNDESAPVRVSHNALEIGPAGGTLVGCQGSRLEPDMHRVLAGHVTWSIAGRQLTLTNPNVGTLRLLDHRPYSDVNRLINHTWIMNAYQARSGDRGSVSYRTTTLRVQRGLYTLHHRCYVVTGGADYRRGLITFGPGTRADLSHCRVLPSPSAGSEVVRDARIDRIVSGMAEWARDGQGLDLTHGDETLLFAPN
jgi:heat shock protein HslJ